MTLPAVRRAAAVGRARETTWIIGSVEAALLRHLSEFDLVEVDRSAGRRGIQGAHRRLRGRRYGTLLHMHPSFRANLVSLGVRARRRIGVPKARSKDLHRAFVHERVPRGQSPARVHFAAEMLRFVRALGANEPPGGPARAHADGPALPHRIPIPEEQRDRARQTRADLDARSRPLVVISPFASGGPADERAWPLERYAAVARTAARKHGAVVAITGSPAPWQTNAARRLSEMSGASNLCGQTSLVQLLAFCAEADAVVAPDSGTAHVCAAAGGRVVGLYAATSPGHTGPLGEGHVIVDRHADALNMTGGKGTWGRRIRQPGAMDLISVEEVTRALDAVIADTAWNRAARKVAQWRAGGDGIVLTNGCFDLLHPGHRAALKQAAAHGDRLVVGLNTDASVRGLKGPGRPVQPLAPRAEALEQLPEVDRVVPFDQADPAELIRFLRPDVLAKGADYSRGDLPGAWDVESRGGEVVFTEIVPGYSTTALLEAGAVKR